MKPLFTALHTTTGFTATGTGAAHEVVGYDLPIAVLVGGTFVGTVKVEVSMDGTTFVQFGADVTAAGTVKIDIPVKQVRAHCSAYTSGTILCYLGAVDSNHDDTV